MSKKKDNTVHIIGDNIYDMAIAYEFNGKNYVKLDFFLAKINEKDKLILDLEAKLAKSEHRNEQLVDALNGEVFINYKLPMENAQLKQQLAEKERENKDLHTAINLSIPNQIAMKDEIERLHTCRDERISELVEENNDLKQQLEEKEQQIESYKHTIYMNMLNQEMLELRVATQDQAKISFAVEQLEKVKASIEVRIVIIQENYTDDLYTEKEYLDMTVENENILKKIDNQINVLRNNKDGIH